jgi:hypothetical protein
VGCSRAGLQWVAIGLRVMRQFFCDDCFAVVVNETFGGPMQLQLSRIGGSCGMR